jgi:NAD(P)-dependent dehydrogenase (short-subunit alcohol dehydrogenase family)
VSALDGKVALVTGAAQGIGAAYAKALAAKGAAVCVSDVIETSQVVSVIHQAGGRALGVVADVTDPAAIEAMVAKAAETFGSVDILVNNAAMFGKLDLKPFAQIGSAEFDAVMKVNVRGTFECCKAVMPHMRRQRYGKIVNVASGTVFKGTPMLLHYVASKGAVVALTRALAREVGEDGIRVNCIAPGLTMSENVRENPTWADGVKANIASRCLKREEEPEDLVGTVVFLCSPESDFMTGQTLVVDGGSAMH